MGNAPHVGSGGADHIQNNFQYDLPEYHGKTRMGNGKFMKSFHCKKKGVKVVVKVYVLHEKETGEILKGPKKKIQEVNEKLKGIPNVMPCVYYDPNEEKKNGKQTARNKVAYSPAAYLHRQFYYTNLHDRLSTRPFLSLVEKKWITYQLFKAVEKCHELGVCHGDIKTENVMVTSWTWIVLTDFASFKPTYLPDDDPTDFNYYFASSQAGQHRCYLAPERFMEKKMYKEKYKEELANSDICELTDKMDVFSLGCVIAEVFLGGDAVMDLPTLLTFRKGNLAALDAKLDKINEPWVKNLVKNMLESDPYARETVKQYLQKCEKTVIDQNNNSTAFPRAFSAFLYDFMEMLHRKAQTPDERLRIVCQRYGEIVKATTGKEDPEGVAFFSYFVPRPEDISQAQGNEEEKASCSDEDKSATAKKKPKKIVKKPKREPFLTAQLTALEAETKALIEGLEGSSIGGGRNEISTDSPPGADSSSSGTHPPPAPDLKETEVSTVEEAETSLPMLDSEDCLVVIIQLVCSSIRHVRKPQLKLIALQLILRLGTLAKEDEVRLQRLTPTVMWFLKAEEENASVRASAIRVLTKLLSQVQGFQAVDSDIFPKYIIPAIEKMPLDREDTVRIAFAESLTTLAETAKRFLELSQSNQYRGGGSSTTQQTSTTDRSKDALSEVSDNSTSTSTSLSADTPLRSIASRSLLANNENEAAPMDEKLDKLRSEFLKFVQNIIVNKQTNQTSSSSIATRALLGDTTRLCIFFGRKFTDKEFVPLFLCIPNQTSWELRYAFFDHIPEICAFLGRAVTGYISPFFDNNNMFHSKELVVSRSLRCLATVVELGLLGKDILTERFAACAPLLLHPGPFVRHGALLLVEAIAKHYDFAAKQSELFPSLRPFLVHSLEDSATITVSVLEDAILPPVSRRALNVALDCKRQTTHQMIRSGSERSLTHALSAQPQLSALSNEEKEKLKYMDAYLIQIAKNLVQQTRNQDQDTSSIRSMPSKPELEPPRPQTRGRSGSSAVRSSSQPQPVVQPRKVTSIDESQLHQHSNKLLLGKKKPPLNKLYIPSTGHRPTIMDTKQERALVERQESLRSLRSDMHRKLEDTSALALDYCTTNRLLEAIPKDLNNMSSFRDLHGISSRPLPRDLYDDSEDPGNESAADVTKSTGSKKGKGGRDRQTEENERMNVISDMDPSTLHRVVLALGIPPLPPRLGFSRSLLDDRNESTDKATKLNKEWRPKVNKYGGVVVATLNEHCLTDKPRLMSKTDAHSGAVNRICVSQDQSFFVTASNDGTARVWGTSQLDQTVTPKAAAIYKQQKGRILDACMVDSTHSVCSASDQGSVHVWRVELAGEKKTQTVRQVDKFEEGPVLTTFYYSTDHASMLLYGTQRGFIHGWDLRSDSEPWRGGGLNVPPELGFLTSTSVGTDKNWLCVGTSRGFILLWDLRFRLLVKLWRHSSHGPIYRLATCARLPGESESSSPGPLAFVAAANNEIAVWNLSTGGKCLRCFRSLSPQDTKDPTAMMPELEEHKIPTHPLTPIFNASQQLDMLREQKKMVPTHSVRAIMGRINSSEKKNSFVMTGSTDRHIRFWDFNTPAKCFTISGLEPGQPRPAYDSIPIRTNLETKLIVCYDAEVPSADNVVPSHLPIREQRGIHCATTSHGDAILDLKSVDLPRRMLLSSSRDGVVKCWR